MPLSRHRFWTAVLVTSMLVPLGGALAALTAGPSGAAVTSYTDATVLGPSAIANGPDGGLWFTNAGNASIGEITTGGVISNFTDPSIAQPSGITAAIDGNMWFTNEANNSIGQITTDGSGTVSRFTDPTISYPIGITSGPDGDVWFTNAGNGSIGHITTDGSATVTNFTAASISFPTGIVSGPDGNLWFTNAGNNSIGRITTAGVVSNFTAASISNPSGITTGPDGNLWFTNSGNGSIGRITTSGVVTNFTNSTISSPRGIVTGPDNALWFTNAGNGSIGRITTGGVVSKISAPSISAPQGIASGPDKALWFTNAGNSSIGRVTVQVPGVPTGVKAFPYGNGGALVAWSAPPDNGSPITAYVVRPYLGTVPQPARVFNSTRTFQVVNGLQNGKTYQFTVAARNAGGTGAPSVKTAAIVVGVPGPPKNVTAVKTAPGALKVSFDAAANNGATITSYKAFCTSSNGGVTNSKSGAASPITVTGLTAGKTYTCRVNATNSRGTGALSAPSAPVTA